VTFTVAEPVPVNPPGVIVHELFVLLTTVIVLGPPLVWNVALTLLFEDMLTVQLLPLELVHPDQLETSLRRSSPKLV
jgi:hypothetical protein